MAPWDETDYQQMRESLAQASQRYQLLIHTYCFMPNHFHLLVEFLCQAPALESRQQYYRPEHFPLLGELSLPPGQEPCRWAGRSYTGTRLGLEELASTSSI